MHHPLMTIITLFRCIITIMMKMICLMSMMRLNLKIILLKNVL